MVRLEDITGKVLSGEWGDDDLYGTGIPVLRTTNFTNNGIVNYENVVTRRIPQKDLSKKYLRYGDIIIEKSGGSDKQPVGRVVFFEGEENKYLFNNFTGVLRVRDATVWFPKYIFYSMYANYQKGGTRRYENKTTGLHNLKTDQYVSSFQVNSRPLAEQKHIVKQLDKVSDLIALRKQQLAKLDELVKSRFIELFGDPEDSTTKWERTTFSSVCIDMHQGINTVADKVEYVNSGFPIIQSKNITSGYLDLEDVRYVTESDYEYYRNKYNPKTSDLLVCNIGTIGKSLIVKNEVDFLIAWNLFLIKLNKELVNPIFIKVFIELLNQQNYFEKFMTGGTVKFVNKKTMGNISTPIPPLALQEQFAAFVEQTDKSKLEIQTALTQFETLKKSLMQQYFG